MPQTSVFLQLAIASVLLGPQANSSQPKTLPQMIANLGSKTEIDDLAAFNKQRTKAIVLLALELNTIDSPEIPDQDRKFEKALHIIWCIRALEKLTEKSFTATTTYRFDIEGNIDELYRAMHVAADGPKGNRCRFSGLWETKLTHYIAPIDAQKEIIRQWQELANLSQRGRGLTIRSTRTLPLRGNVRSSRAASAAPVNSFR